MQIDPQLLNIQVIKPTINAQGQHVPMSKEQQQKLLQQNFLIQNQMIQSQQVQTVIEPIVIYLEHMSKETLDVAKSHTSWMNFKDNSQF